MPKHVFFWDERWSLHHEILIFWIGNPVYLYACNTLKIWTSHRSILEVSDLLGCAVMSLGQRFPSVSKAWQSLRNIRNHSPCDTASHPRRC